MGFGMRQGDKYRTNNFGYLKVVEYISARRVVVEFIATGFKKTTTSKKIRDGVVKDLMMPSKYGVGYIGVGCYTARSRAYKVWAHMITRCYSPESLERRPTYKGCSVAVEWHNYQNFAEWYEENYVEGYQLDKDLLVVGNKLYSEGTCVFVPSSINNFTINSATSRGTSPVGVSHRKRDNKYVAYCNNGAGDLHYLGLFTNSEQAHLAWRNCKLGLADKMKVEMDGIDERIYPNVITIINNSAKGGIK